MIALFILGALAAFQDRSLFNKRGSTTVAGKTFNYDFQVFETTTEPVPADYQNATVEHLTSNLKEDIEPVAIGMFIEALDGEPFNTVLYVSNPEIDGNTSGFTCLRLGLEPFKLFG